eukprot:GHVP01051473.1.p1 GENE.GHVP01051473.1~~GHVP01051473.1.p1  ORF type:complete len:764 (-),score=146.76 GHVP01051473.1:5773-8064(-)
MSPYNRDLNLNENSSPEVRQKEGKLNYSENLQTPLRRPQGRSVVPSYPRDVTPVRNKNTDAGDAVTPFFNSPSRSRRLKKAAADGALGSSGYFGIEEKNVPLHMEFYFLSVEQSCRTNFRIRNFKQCILTFNRSVNHVFQFAKPSLVEYFVRNTALNFDKRNLDNCQRTIFSPFVDFTNVKPQTFLGISGSFECLIDRQARSLLGMVEDGGQDSLFSSDQFFPLYHSETPQESTKMEKYVEFCCNSFAALVRCLSSRASVQHFDSDEKQTRFILLIELLICRTDELFLPYKETITTESLCIWCETMCHLLKTALGCRDFLGFDSKILPSLSSSIVTVIEKLDKIKNNLDGLLTTTHLYFLSRICEFLTEADLEITPEPITKKGRTRKAKLKKPDPFSVRYFRILHYLMESAKILASMRPQKFSVVFSKGSSFLIEEKNVSFLFNSEHQESSFSFSNRNTIVGVVRALWNLSCVSENLNLNSLSRFFNSTGAFFLRPEFDRIKDNIDIISKDDCTLLFTFYNFLLNTIFYEVDNLPSFDVFNKKICGFGESSCLSILEELIRHQSLVGLGECMKDDPSVVHYYFTLSILVSCLKEKNLQINCLDLSLLDKQILQICLNAESGSVSDLFSSYSSIAYMYLQFGTLKIERNFARIIWILQECFSNWLLLEPICINYGQKWKQKCAHCIGSVSKRFALHEDLYTEISRSWWLSQGRRVFPFMTEIFRSSSPIWNAEFVEKKIEELSCDQNRIYDYNRLISLGEIFWI